MWILVSARSNHISVHFCKLRIGRCVYDVDYAVQSTEFEGEVPTLMSLPQIRNLRFQFDLRSDKALGMKNMTLR